MKKMLFILWLFVTNFVLGNKVAILENAKSILEKAEETQFSEPEMSLLLARKAYTFATNENDYESQLVAKRIEGTVLLNLNKPNESLIVFLDALEQSLVLKDKYEEARIRNNLAVIYQDFKEYDKSIENLFLALELNTEIEDLFGEASNLVNIGVNYTLVGQNEKALFWFNLAAEKAQKLKNLQQLAGIFSNIASIHSSNSDYQKAIAQTGRRPSATRQQRG